MLPLLQSLIGFKNDGGRKILGAGLRNFILPKTLRNGLQTRSGSGLGLFWMGYIITPEAILGFWIHFVLLSDHTRPYRCQCRFVNHNKTARNAVFVIGIHQ